MDIVILGAGKTGSFLAKTLSQEQHNITIIDKNPKPLEKLSRIADVAMRSGSGTDPHLLEEIAEQDPDLFIALTSDDETNLSACLIAKTLGIKKTAARIQKTSLIEKSLIDVQQVFRVDHLIGASVLVAHDILKAILNPGNVFVETFAHGAAQLRTIVIPDTWPYNEKPLKEIHFDKNILVALIKRVSSKGVKKILFPKGDDVICAKDEVSLIGEISHMLELPKIFGQQVKKTDMVVILGGTNTAFELMTLLSRLHINVKLVDKDEDICKKFAAAFPKATIIQQDGADFSFLLSEQIGAADAFVACSNKDDTNILCSFLAKKAGCKEIISLVNTATYVPLLKELGIGFVLSEKVSVSNRVHAILYEKNITSLSSLYENAALLLEIKVSTQSEIVGIPLSELRHHLPEDLLIGIIENRGRIVIPRGNNIVSPGDTVVAISSPKHIKELEALF